MSANNKSFFNITEDKNGNESSTPRRQGYNQATGS